ncbi:MAG: TIGR03936 family radical SAM-associated protein [Bacillota bacterium]
MSVIKLIVKYKKTGYMKYLSHLEMVNLIERVLRRVNVPFEFSEGYNPKPQISFAAPLAVGVISQAEYFDVKIKSKFDLNKIKKIDKSFLPKGIEFIDAKFTKNKKSIMALVKSADYILKTKMKDDIDKNYLINKLEDFLNEDEIIWTKIRRKKSPIDKDILKLINKFSFLHKNNNEVFFKINAKTGSSGNLKPEVALNKFLEYASLEKKDDYIMVERKEIYKEKFEPII